VLLRGCRCLEIDVWDGQDKSRKPIDDKGCYPHNSDGDAAVTETVIKHEEDLQRTGTHNGNEENAEKGDGESLGRLKSLSSKMGHLIRHHSSSGEDADSLTTVSTVDVVATRGEPRVLHGHTLTKEVSFRDVCYAIRDSAFVTSDLPLIISLEVHACLEQQEIMVEVMKDAWAGFLVDITPDLEVAHCKLPRLGDLKRKILVKTKWVPSKSNESQDSGAGTSPQGTGFAASATNKIADDKSTMPPEQPLKEKVSKTLHALSRLAVYTRGCHFHDFTQPGK
jgi:Phosphatidylinositol-specific phospholipase C, X domain